MREIDRMAVGELLKKHRQERGIKVSDLRQLFGYGTDVPILRWEDGISLPSVDHLDALAELYGTTLDDLIIYKQGG